MRRIVLFMHTSLDGFVAGPNGEMDWIIVDEEIFVYAGNQTDKSDTALYGRVTYELMENYWPTAAQKPNASKHDILHSTWYNKVHKVVLSTTMKGVDLPNTTIISDNVSNEVMKMKQQAGKEIVIFGSPSVGHLLMQQNLIDDYWFFVNPILLGEGIPLFKNIHHRTKLKLIKSTQFISGVVCLHYEKI